MVVLPALTAVVVPFVPIVATPVFELLHAPPLTVDDSVVVAVAHIEDAPLSVPA
jgi:hypothetical protein